MSNECLIAEFPDRESLSTALQVLRKADFGDDDFSLVTQSDEVDQTKLDAAIDTTPASPPTGKTMEASTLAGGTLGAVLGTATMMGPMLVAGPIAGMAAGVFGGSLLSAVESWGVKHDVAEDYEKKVSAGSSLIVVNGNDLKLAEAERVLKTCGPASLEKFPAK